MNKYEEQTSLLKQNPRTWLVTGVAGFIGSNLLEQLLKLNQKVVGIDNFATGHRSNLAEVQCEVDLAQWTNFSFIEGDIRDLAACEKACQNVNYVLHQAALGSVPRSISDPINTNAVNVDGFLNMIVAAKDAGVEKFVYAASSSTYGDHPTLPKQEAVIGNPLSPYAVTKYVNELYADVFAKNYQTRSIGLRYFNVFGRRQDPNGAYAAVIPKWANRILNSEDVEIYGDGKTSRDFCYIDNVVQANILAATTMNPEAINQVYNVACGKRTSLNQLYDELSTLLSERCEHVNRKPPVHRDFRDGDVRHSLADISKAQTLLNYFPQYEFSDGLKMALDWYVKNNSEFQ